MRKTLQALQDPVHTGDASEVRSLGFSKKSPSYKIERYEKPAPEIHGQRAKFSSKTG
jgi:hypothetical protein